MVTEDKMWFSVPEASEYLSVSRGLLYSLMKDGRLKFYYITGTKQRRLKKEDLDALMVEGKPTDDLAEDEE